MSNLNIKEAIGESSMTEKCEEESNQMVNYHGLMNSILNNGIDQFNTRTGHICRAVVGTQLQYDLRKEFPAITTKKLYFKGMVGELLGFYRGYDNAADFRKLGCNIWDQNANEDGVDSNGKVVPNLWLRNPYRKGTDDLGRIYGVQWTQWSDKRLVNKVEAERLFSSNLGYQYIGRIEKNSDEYIIERKINQLENALRTLLTNPSDRRIIVTAWNPAELDMMALPPCHMDYKFVAFENPKVLHIVMTIR